MVMIWLIVCGCVVTVGLAIGGLILRRRHTSARDTEYVDAGMYQVMVDLYAIKRRFDVFQFKVETRQAHTHASRQMSKQLRDLRRRERES
jgi:uncharacterized membrane-anchored protein YhcB (DUF1043 family)